jgi:hypothetical protein
MSRLNINLPMAWWAMQRQRKRRRARIERVVVPPPDDIDPADYRMRLRANSIELNVGESIASWADLSGNGSDAAQATVAFRPTLQEVTFGGKTFRVARFDTVDDGMDTPLVIAESSPFSIFVLWRPADVDSISAIVSSASENWTMGTYGGGMICYFGNWTAGGVVNTSDFYLFEVRITPGQDPTWAYLNGVQTEPVGPGPGSTPPGQVALGSAGTVGYPGGCDAAEILIYDRLLSDAEADSVRAYFQTQYNYLQT